MSDATKEFPASELKLERLRAEGEVPISSDVLNLGLLLGAVLGVFLLFGTAVEVLEASVTSAVVSDSGVSPQASDDVVEAFLDSLLQALRFSFIVLFPLLVGVLLSGLIQTRFLITLDPALPRFSRLWFSGPSFFNRVSVAFVSLLKVLLWLAASFLFFKLLLAERYVDDEALSFSRSVESIGESRELPQVAIRGHRIASTYFFGFLITSLGYCVILGVVSRILVSSLFYRRHKMTRAEVDAEYRETEVGVEMKSARSERYSSESDE